MTPKFDISQLNNKFTDKIETNHLTFTLIDGQELKFKKLAEQIITDFAKDSSTLLEIVQKIGNNNIVEFKSIDELIQEKLRNFIDEYDCYVFFSENSLKIPRLNNDFLQVEGNNQQIMTELLNFSLEYGYELNVFCQEYTKKNPQSGYLKAIDEFTSTLTNNCIIESVTIAFKQKMCECIFATKEI